MFASVGILSDETIVAQHPWVDDPQKEMERLEKQREKEREEAESQYNPFGKPKTDPNNPTEQNTPDNEE